MRLWGNLAMMWPIRLDAGRLGTNVSLALAIDGTLHCGCCGIIVVDRCIGAKAKPQQTRVGNAVVVVGRMEGRISAIKLSNS